MHYFLSLVIYATGANGNPGSSSTLLIPFDNKVSCEDAKPVFEARYSVRIGGISFEAVGLCTRSA